MLQNNKTKEGRFHIKNVLQKLFLDEIFDSKSLCFKQEEIACLDISCSLKANEVEYSYLVLKLVFSSLSYTYKFSIIQFDSEH